MLESAGFLTQHMAAHVVAMNVVAPLLAGALVRSESRIAEQRLSLAAAATLQIVLLWGWHSPAVLAEAFAVAPLLLAMHISLFLAAVWFWLAVMGEAKRGGWFPLAALLVTGKLFCLLGILLTFAPRVLYEQAAIICFGSAASAELILKDQQLAGLLMLTACPMVYVTAALMIARRRLIVLGRSGGWSLPRRAV
jgi:putative membrane protein